MLHIVCLFKSLMLRWIVRPRPTSSHQSLSHSISNTNNKQARKKKKKKKTRQQMSDRIFHYFSPLCSEKTTKTYKKKQKKTDERMKIERRGTTGEAKNSK